MVTRKVSDLLLGRVPLPTYLQGAAWIYAAQIIRGGLALVVVTLASHLLPISEFGVFSFVQNFFLWIALFVEMGIGSAAARVLSLEPESEWNKTLSAFTLVFGAISLVASLLIFVCAGLTAKFFHLPLRETLMACALPGLGVLWLTALRLLLPSLERARAIAFLEAAPWAIMCLAIILIGPHARTAMAFSLIFVSSYLVSIVGLMFSLLRAFRPDWAEVRSLLRVGKSFGLAVYGSRLVSTGGFILDIPLLALFLHDTKAIAFYSMAKSLSAPLAVVGQSIATALFRRFAGAARIGRNAILMVCGVTAVLALGYIALAKPVIHLLLPPAYQGIYGYLMLWTLTTSLQSLYQLPTNYLQAQGKGGTLGLLSASFGISAALSYLMLIPRFGVWGACMSALIAVAIWTVGSWFFYARQADKNKLISGA